MIVVTGAAGCFAREVVLALYDRGVPTSGIAVVVGDPGGTGDLAAAGVDVRRVDHERPRTLASAFDGAEKVLVVPDGDLGPGVSHLRALIDAASAAGARLIAYAGVLQPDATVLAAGPGHSVVEGHLRACGTPYAVLRNGWCAEHCEPTVRQGIATGVITGAAGDGRIASASIADYAAAAAVVLTTEGHENTVRELSGDTAWSMPDLAATLTEITGRPISYRYVPPRRQALALARAGVPLPAARAVARVDAAISAGHLGAASDALSRLIGRPTVPLEETLTAIVADIGPDAVRGTPWVRG